MCKKINKEREREGERQYGTAQEKRAKTIQCSKIWLKYEPHVSKEGLLRHTRTHTHHCSKQGDLPYLTGLLLSSLDIFKFLTPSFVLESPQTTCFSVKIYFFASSKMADSPLFLPVYMPVGLNLCGLCGHALRIPLLTQLTQ